MKKSYTIILLLLISFNSLNAQITDFITDVYTRKILVDGDYLYYYDYNTFTLELEIKRINLNTPVPSIEIVFSGISLSPAGIAKDENFIYTSSYNSATDEQRIYKIDILEPDEPEELLTTFYTSGGVDIAYGSNFLYVNNSDDELKRMNLLSTPPIAITTLETIEDIDITCYHVDGFTLYIGTYSGDIYTKNLLTAAPASLLHSLDATLIRDIYLFEGFLYYCYSDGVYRFNPLDAIPTIQTLAVDSDFYNYPYDLSAKLLDSGEKYLYVSDWLQKIIRIDLNDPTLSIRETVANKAVVYPNPSQNTITIKTNSSIEELSVFDLLGKRVFNLSYSSPIFEYSLDMSTLNSGVYNLQIKTDKGFEFKKLVKE